MEGWPCGKALVSFRLCACCHVVHLLLSCVICLSTKDPAGLRPCTYRFASHVTKAASAGIAAACQYCFRCIVALCCVLHRGRTSPVWEAKAGLIQA